MGERDRKEEPLIAPGATGMVGGRAVVPDDEVFPGDDDPNGPVPDDEEDQDAPEEDADLLDTRSPEFDHSLRQHRATS